MKKWLVTLEETATYEVEVEAENSDDAAEAAEEAFVQNDPGVQFVAVSERDAIDVSEIEESD